LVDESRPSVLLVLPGLVKLGVGAIVVWIPPADGERPQPVPVSGLLELDASVGRIAISTVGMEPLRPPPQIPLAFCVYRIS